MCELFAMSSNEPATVTFSLAALSRHGGGDGPNTDGWGVAFYDGADARVLREPEAAFHSPWVRFIEKQGPKSRLVISHIRRASVGARALADTHPFSRALGGRRHIFAHNGSAPGVFDDQRFALGARAPIGATDSECAFCALLTRLAPLWTDRKRPPPLVERAAIVENFAAEMKSLGPANFLYSDSEYLFAFGDRRRQADGRIAAPGLHVLSRRCKERDGNIDIEGVDVGRENQTATLLASVPLSDEEWRPLPEGELAIFCAGEVIDQRRCA